MEELRSFDLIEKAEEHADLVAAAAAAAAIWAQTPTPCRTSLEPHSPSCGDDAEVQCRVQAWLWTVKGLERLHEMDALELFKLFGSPKIGGVIIDKHLDLFERMGETHRALVDSGLIAESSCEGSASPEAPSAIEMNQAEHLQHRSRDPAPAASEFLCSFKEEAGRRERQEKAGGGRGRGGCRTCEEKSKSNPCFERGGLLIFLSDILRRWQIYCGRNDGRAEKGTQRSGL